MSVKKGERNPIKDSLPHLLPGWTMAKTKLLIIVSALLFISGAGLLSLQVIRNHQISQVVRPPTGQVTTAVPQSSSSVISGQPTYLTIDSLHIALPVINGYYNSKTQTWVLTTDKAQYATITPLPNDRSGNTFIYGHYRSEVFASLHKITPGATATITTSNHRQFIYEFTSSHITDPNDDSLFHYQGPPILTLQTCTGLFFQNRQLFTFNLVRVV